MSAIGSGSMGALNIAGSVAGTQRNNATADQARAEAAEKSFQIDAARLTAQLHGDVSDPELSTDRDADGRMPYDETGRQPESPPDEAVVEKSRRSADAAGILGNTLDLEV